MQNFFLTVARFALSAWVGGAVLFVITSVREVIHPGFDSLIKNQLAALRFPPYYLFGFLLIGLGIVGGLVGLRGAAGRWRFRLFALTSIVALILMTVDYVTIFQPLYETVTRADGIRDERFQRLHIASTRINTLNVALCVMAAMLVCWPTSSESLDQAERT